MIYWEQCGGEEVQSAFPLYLNTQTWIANKEHAAFLGWPVVVLISLLEILALSKEESTGK